MNLILLIIGSILIGNGVNAATGWGAFLIGLACLDGGIKLEFRE